MDPKLTELLRRQAEWQKTLKDRPWPQKMRIAEKLRDAMITLRNAPVIESGEKKEPSED